MPRPPQARQYQRSTIGPVLIAIIILCGSAAAPWAGETAAVGKRASERQEQDTGVEAGARRFEHNCAICHGLDARGNGPFAELLNVKPPDLTLLSRAAGGDFPFSRVYQRIDGRELPLAHGNRSMPIWGQRLKREGGDETYVRGRIFEIMLYLESLQQN